jgi:hypothetical protein
VRQFQARHQADTDEDAVAGLSEADDGPAGLSDVAGPAGDEAPAI